MKTPGQKITGYKHAFAQSSACRTRRRRERAAQQTGRLLRCERPLLAFQGVARKGDELDRQGGDWLLVAKNHPIAGLDIVRPVLFNHSEQVAPEEETARASHRIPAFGVEIIHAIGEHKAEAS